MHLPADLKYAKTHEWARQDGDSLITVGITDHAQETLGDIVFLELPEIGRKFEAGAECAMVESVKAASDIHAPVSGEIVATNQAAADAPESINQDAYDVWLFKIKAHDAARCAAELGALQDAGAYATAAENE